MKVLFILMLSILFLAILTAIFSVFTIYLRYRNDQHRERYNRLEKVWNPKIFDFLNDEITIEEFFFKAKIEDNEFFIDYLYRFEQRLQGKSKDKIKSLAKPYLKYLEKDIFSNSPEVRAKTLMILGNLDEGDYFDEIVKSLDDKSPVVSIIAAKTLAVLGRIDAFDSVVMHLERYETWSKTMLARNLSLFGSEACEQLRFIFINKDFSTTLRVIAADTLVILNDFEIHNIAFDILKGEEDKEIKAACLRLLLNTEVKEYIDYIRFLVYDESFIIRLYSLKLLGKVGNITDHKIFIDLLKDNEPWIRIHAARALKQTRGIDVLMQLSKEKDMVHGYDAVRQVLSEE